MLCLNRVSAADSMRNRKERCKRQTVYVTQNVYPMVKSN